jgi:hypothetical protein
MLIAYCGLMLFSCDVLVSSVFCSLKCCNVSLVLSLYCFRLVCLTTRNTAEQNVVRSLPVDCEAIWSRLPMHGRVERHFCHLLFIRSSEFSVRGLLSNKPYL